jgi:hypothetical protein
MQRVINVPLHLPQCNKSTRLGNSLLISQRHHGVPTDPLSQGVGELFEG